MIELHVLVEAHSNPSHQALLNPVISLRDLLVQKILQVYGVDLIGNQIVMICFPYHFFQLRQILARVNIH